MFHNHYPFFDESKGGAAIEGMIAALRRFARDYPTATFVPGHGPLATAADVIRYAGYLDYVRTHVKQSLDKGMDIDVAEDRIDLSGWNLGILPSFHDNNLKWATAGSNIRAIYRLLLAENGQSRPKGQADSQQP